MRNLTPRFILLLLITLAATSQACGKTDEDRLDQIRELHAEGRFAETVENLRFLRDKRPDDADRNHLYGAALLASGNPSLAIWPLRAAAEAPSSGLDADVLLARALLQGASVEDGIAQLLRVLETDPVHMEALILLAGAHRKLNQHDVVLDVAERALAVDPIRPAPLLWKIEALAELGRLDEAEETLTANAATFAGSPASAGLESRVCGMHAEIQEIRGELGAAEVTWEQCIEKFPNASPLIAEAVRFFDQQADPERASSILRTALKSAPGNSGFRSTLVSRLNRAGRFEEAEQLLLEATLLERNHQAAWLALASHYREREDFTSAVLAVERILTETQSAEPLVLAQYADDLIQIGQFEHADEIIGYLKSPAYVTLLKGRMLIAKGKPRAALDVLDQGLKLWPGNPMARYLAGQAAEQLGDFDRAIVEYKESARADPLHTNASVRLAQLYAAQEQYGPALTILDHRLRADDTDPKTYIWVARIASRAGHRKAAAAAIQKLEQLPGQRSVAVVEAAAALDRMGGADPAIALINRRALDLTDPTNAAVLQAMVVYLLKEGRYEDALRHTGAAIEASSDEAVFHEIHARALRASDAEFEEVLVHVMRALEIAPDHANSLSLWADLEAKEGRVGQAIELYDRAAAIDPDDPNYAWASIRLLESSGTADLALRLDRLVQKDPMHAKAANLLAQRLLSRGELDGAWLRAKQAVRFRGGADALDTKGRVAAARGEFQAAIRSFRRAVELQPRVSSIRYHLARALMATGDREGARRELHEALEMGEFAEADDARAELAKLEGLNDA